MDASGGAAANVQDSKTRQLVMVTGMVAVAIVLAALFTGVRKVAYAALATVVLAGFWPIILLVGICALVILLGIAVVLLAPDGPPALDLGDPGGIGDPSDWTKLIRWYYRWLSRLRHPVALGTGAGLIVGTGAVWLLMIVSVIPNERQTLATLLRVQETLERHYREHARYPAPGPNGTVPRELVEGASGASTTDAFGRAVSYRVAGTGLLSAYTVSSLGADGRPSSDDLCVEGEARPARWIRRATEVLGAFVDHDSITKLSETVGALESARCARKQE